MNKIWINYDLIDKVREAKTGFSLHKYLKVVAFVNGVMIPAKLLGASLGGLPLDEIIFDIFGNFLYTLWCNGAISFSFSFYRKDMAIEQLSELSEKLRCLCIETDVELLKETYQYDVEYRVDFESFPPKIIQIKYMKVPVYNDFGNNERSVKQEYVLGTNGHVLSYGEPEEKEKRLYARRRVIQRQ